MDYDALLLDILIVPILGAVIAPLLGVRSARARNIWSLFCVAVPLALSLCLIPPVLRGETVLFFVPLPLGLDFLLVADSLAVFMAIVSSLISSIIMVYSFDYIAHYRNQNEYYFLVVLFLGAMMGIVFSQNLVFLYLFWEITAFTSWRLIGFFREPAHVVRADKSFLVTVFGALVMLIGFLLIWEQTGSFNLPIIREIMKTSPISNLAVALILAGILSKSATLPFHTWLPDAGVAPSPVTALLHAAVLVKIGVYVFARLFIATVAPDVLWHTVVPVIAGTSALIAACAALIDTDLKRIIAFSTISQIGFIFLGLSTGTAVGFAGALLYILFHGLAKAGLFLSAGIVEQGTHTKDITRLGGLIKTMPVTAISFLMCAASVMGIPPFGGFFNKYMVFAGAVQSGQPAIAFLFLAGAVLTILYLWRTFSMVFLGDVREQGKEGSPVMVGSVALLAFLSIAGGLLIRYPLQFVEFIVRSVSG